MEYVNERANKIVGHAGWLVVAVIVSKKILMQTFNYEILDILRDLKHNNPHVTLRNISDFLDGVDAYFLIVN